MLRFSTPSVTVCVPKALKDSDQVAQGDGEESPAAEEQLLGEVLTFLIFNMGKICGLFISQWNMENFLAACSSIKLAYIFLEMLKIGVCLLIWQKCHF